MIPLERLFAIEGAGPDSGPLGHLTACHRRIEERLASFVRAGNFLDERTVEALAIIDQNLRFMRGSGALHTEDEEVSVFPRLAPKISVADAEYLEALEHEHAAADEALERLIGVVDQIRSQGVAPQLVHAYTRAAYQLSDLYRAHIASEDAHLLHLARITLTPGELAQIETEMKARRQAV